MGTIDHTVTTRPDPLNTLRTEIYRTVMAAMTEDETDAYHGEVSVPADAPIVFGQLWSCCVGNEAKVIVFDNGSRHAVCRRCAQAYPGEVRELPAGTVPHLPLGASVDVLLPVPADGAADAARCVITGQIGCDLRSCELHYMSAPIRLAPDEGDFAAAHDAHMARAYAEPWDEVPTDDPTSGDPLTGRYGRTYAEEGWVLMQAARDLFGPYPGHCPVLLFRQSLDVMRTGDAPVLTYAEAYDTWDQALRALRWHVTHAGPGGARTDAADAEMTVARAGLLRNGSMTWADGTVDYPDYEDGCEGHPAGPFDPMGETVYCDGTCQN